MGIDVLNLSNNHMRDYGCPGLEDAIAALDRSTAEVRDDMDELKPQVDILFVSFHWAVPFSWGEITPQMRQAGQAFIDAGAHAMLGHGNHQLAGMENYRGRPIVYDMGNFLFDMNNVKWINRQGYFRFVVSAKGVQSLEFIPYLFKRPESQAIIPPPNIAKATKERMAKLTSDFDSRTFRDKEDKLFLDLSAEASSTPP